MIFGKKNVIFSNEIRIKSSNFAPEILNQAIIMAKENENNMPQEPVTPPAAPASETPNRDKWMANMRAKYGEDLSEDELYGKSTEGYDAEHEYAKRSREEGAKLNGYLQQDQNVNDFFVDLFQFGAEGKPWKAMARMKPLMQQYINGEITDEEYEAEMKRMAEDDAKAKRLKAMAEEAWNEECAERGWDPEETKQKLYALIGNDCETKEECREQVKNMLRVLDYEPAVAAAEVRGKNAKIKEEKRNHPSGIDTLPRNGGVAAASATPQRKQSIFDVARDAE